MNNPTFLNYLDKNINIFGTETTNYVLQCAISRNKKIKTVFNCIFVYFTKLFIHSVIVLFNHYNYNLYNAGDYKVKEDILVNILYELYKPDLDITQNIVNIDKPGIHFQKDILKNFVSKIIKDEPLNDEFLVYLNKHIPLSVVMGAIYGVITNPAIFLLFYISYSINNSLQQALSGSDLKNILPRFINLYGLPNNFSKTNFFNLLYEIIPNLPIDATIAVNPVDKQPETIIRFIKSYRTQDENPTINKNIHAFILDLFTENSKSIINRNFSNKEYLRQRIERKPHETKKLTRKAPECPKYYYNKDRIIKEQTKIFTSMGKSSDFADPFYITLGQNWYPVNANSLQRRIFELYGRSVNAGYSGSTYMWINFITNLLGINLNDQYLQRIVLLGLISDFVPFYHSIEEVLLVYFKEIGNHIYTLDKSPILHLHDYLNEFSSIKTPDADTTFKMSTLEKQTQLNNDFQTTFKFSKTKPKKISIKDKITTEYIETFFFKFMLDENEYDNCINTLKKHINYTFTQQYNSPRTPSNRTRKNTKFKIPKEHKI
jgi:hypothetical protein